MRTWLELGGRRRVAVDVVVAQAGGAVTAKATVDLTAHGPNAEAAIAALRRRLDMVGAAPLEASDAELEAKAQAAAVKALAGLAGAALVWQVRGVLRAYRDAIAGVDQVAARKAAS